VSSFYGPHDLVANTRRYHSHSELQRADGLYGGLIVHSPMENRDSEQLDLLYDDEILLIIGDWYHRVAEVVHAGYATHDSWGREVSQTQTLILDSF
jgi:FtsP/CotA-like multicopper oxidase with cupredoxin domain